MEKTAKISAISSATPTPNDPDPRYQHLEGGKVVPTSPFRGTEPDSEAASTIILPVSSRTDNKRRRDEDDADQRLGMSKRGKVHEDHSWC
jgi:hypothetical protein